MGPSDFTILIVDDEADLLELIADSFELEGFNVQSTADGNKALELANTDNIHIILCDQNLNDGITGLQVLEKVKENEKLNECKFFLLTGDITLDLNELKAKGVEGIVEKPFDSDQVVEQMKIILGV
ncbi:MAG: response regulator [Bacteriovoracaceae bacterium]